MAIAVGDWIQRRYVIEGAIGDGGGGHAYRALDAATGKRLALKLVAAPRPELIAVLRREFEVLSRVTHANLVRVHDFGVQRLGGLPLPYYTADLVRGATLDRALRGRTYKAARPVVVDLLQALRHLHDLGVRHGDIKPANVLVTDFDRPVLIDLGCAAPFGASPGGTVSGTLDFMAPELRAGEPADGRADLFACGVMLAKVFATLSDVAPKKVQRIIDRMQRPRIEDRPVDAAEVLAVFGASLGPAVAPRRRPGQWVGRQEVLTLGEGLIDRVVGGGAGSRCLILSGPDGSGRSRALMELRWRAELRVEVAEAVGSDPDRLTAMLRRAIDDPTLSRAPVAAVTAAAALRQRGEALVFVVDDAHLLAEDQQEVLAALMRSIERGGAIGLLITTNLGWEPPRTPDGGVIRHALRPLGRSEVAALIAEPTEALVVGQVLELCRGLPAEIHRLLAAARGQPIASLDLPAVLASIHRETQQGLDLTTLSRQALRWLGRLAVIGGESALADLDREEDRELVSSLITSGWIERRRGSLGFVDAGLAEAVMALLGPEVVSELHRQAATELAVTGLDEAGQDPALLATDRKTAGLRSHDWSSATTSSRSARIAGHLTAAGEIAAAEAMVVAHLNEAQTDPQDWLSVAREMATTKASAQGLGAVATIFAAAGRPGDALGVLAAALRQRPAATIRAQLELRAGVVRLRLGQVGRALVHLGRARDLADSVDLRLRIDDQACRAHIRARAYDAAFDLAMKALRDCPDAAVAAHLHQDAGVAASYLGHESVARDHFRRAAERHGASGNAREEVRTLSYHALLDYRTGNLAAARAGHRRALDLAEAAGLGDQIAGVALNLGAVEHQRGDFGPALEVYSRGIAIAAALGVSSTDAALRVNCCQLEADIGLFERCRSDLDQADETIAGIDGGDPVLSATLATIRGQLSMAAGRKDEARTFFTDARKIFAAAGAELESAEVDLHLADIALSERDLDGARTALATAQVVIDGHGARDVMARAELLRGRCFVAEDLAAEALGSLERAAEHAEQVGSRSLQAEVRAWLAIAADRCAAQTLAEGHRHLSRELWERTAAGLPEAMRLTFWAHPSRATVAKAARRGEPNPVPTASAREEKLARLLGINKRLNSSLHVEDVLGFALDAAIELTGAERGFIILAPTREYGAPPAGVSGTEMRVAVARNIGRERIGQAHTKWSRSIAEQVVRTVEPIVTVDAQRDERFGSERSVHAMRLKSIAAVPLVAPDGVLGAVYLDNRLQSGRFAAADVDLLVMLADQIAIALTNARLHDELAERSAELERRRQQIEALATQQAVEIEQLHEEVRSRQAVMELRYDYSAIVGRGPSMRKVLALLERIIDTEVPVLIEGESGTGKELVARAIHHNGPRQGGPFLSLNCGAFPETLLESQLFGHVRGAFTGAERDQEGLLVAASGGTLFLDELGEMPASMQVKLLRALQEREVRPLGATEVIPIDIRVVSATNRRLRDEIGAGRFREDLYYRLAVIEVSLPSLRDRVEDLPGLANHLLERIAAATHRPVPKLTASGLRMLLSHAWPGNVRELENVLTNAVVMADGDTIGAGDLVVAPGSIATEGLPAKAHGGRDRYRQEQLVEVVTALRETGWNVSEVARDMGISRTKLYRILRRGGVSRDPSPSQE